MEVNNPLYKNQGIHLISTIFTVEDGITKVLLIKRKNNPYKDYWALVGGALYNNDAVNKLKEKIYDQDFLKDLFPSEFTLPELQRVYETILGEKLDRRNFRKKLLNLDLIEDTLKEKKFAGNKPSKLYKFK